LLRVKSEVDEKSRKGVQKYFVYAGALKMQRKWVRLKMWRKKNTGEEMVSFWINGELVHTTNLSAPYDSILGYSNRKAKKKRTDSNGPQKEDTELNGTEKADN
jgi:hypothetical protein